MSKAADDRIVLEAARMVILLLNLLQDVLDNPEAAMAMGDPWLERVTKQLNEHNDALRGD